MLFRTEFEVSESEQKINIADKILLAGSCFAENIAEKLSELHWNILSNPHGILFNPASVRQCFRDVSTLKNYSVDSLYLHDGLYHSFNHHGRFSGPNADDVCQNLNKTIFQAHQFLKQADWVIITLGTAWVWSLNETGEAVANCHKVPPKHFTKELLSVKKITNILSETASAITNINSGCRILLSVSPVRYLKDGFVENARSKAHLITAVHKIIEQNQHCQYFPAFELFMDDLRDYRFTKTDMVHPDSTAIEYIWQKFVNAFFSTEAKSFNQDLKRLADMKNHRPFNSNIPQYDSLQLKIEQTQAELLQKYPFLSFE